MNHIADAMANDARTVAVWQALRTVIDPELGRSVVDLGLIYFVAVDGGGTAHIVMTTTTAGCPAVGYLREGIQRAASSVPGVNSAEVAVTYDPPWSPDMINGAAVEVREHPARHRSWRFW